MHVPYILSFLTIIILLGYSVLFNPELFTYFDQLHSVNNELLQAQQELIESKRQLLEAQQHNSNGVYSIIKLENILLVTVICLTFYLGYSFYTSTNNTQDLFISLNDASTANALALNEHITVANRNSTVTLSNSIQAVAEQQTQYQCQIGDLIFEQVTKKLNSIQYLLENRGFANTPTSFSQAHVPGVELSSLQNATWNSFNNN